MRCTWLMGKVSRTELVKKEHLLLSVTMRLASLCVGSSKEDKKGLSASPLSAVRRKNGSHSTKTLPVYLKEGPRFHVSLFLSVLLAPLLLAYRVPVWEYRVSAKHIVLKQFGEAPLLLLRPRL